MIPTITSISPDSGLTMGLTPVKIVGTGFRPAPQPTPVAHQGTGVAQQTVSVTIDGVEADAAVVGDSETIWITVPEYMGVPGYSTAVDVVITNLGDDGQPIAGETVTETDGYTYKRQDLTAEGPVLWVQDQLLDWFKRHILENTAVTTDPEYSDDPAGMIIAMGSLPGIILTGPVVTDDPYRQDRQDREHEVEPGVYTVEKPLRAVTLGYQIHVFGRTKSESVNLRDHADATLSARGKLQILDQRGGSNTINLQMRSTDSWDAADNATTNARTARSALEISGIKLRVAHGNETGPQASPDQPVAWQATAYTLEMTGGI